MTRRRGQTRVIGSGLLGPSIQISGTAEARDGMVIRLLDGRDTRAVVARYTEGQQTLIIEDAELRAMLRMIEGRTVTDVHGMIHQTRRAVR